MTTAPTKKAQEAEANQRAAAGINPAESAAAVDVADDGARGDPGTAQPPLTGREQTEQPAPPPGKSASDRRRDEIVSRWRTQRTEEAENNADDISDFTRSGMPPEWTPPPAEAAAPAVEGDEQEAEPAPTEATEAADPVEPAAPQKVKLLVRGKEVELPLEEIIPHAQRALAGEDYLEEGRTKLKEIDQLLSSTKQRVSVPLGPGQHPVPTAEATAPAEPADPAATDPQHPEGDEVADLIETMQFGDPAEARRKLDATLSKRTQAAVTQAIQTERLRDEGARTAKVLSEFKAQHPELANDPLAAAAMERRVLDLQVEDLKGIGVDPATLQTYHGGPATPADIAQAHLWYRSNGFKVRQPSDMLVKAAEDVSTWRKPAPTSPTPPAPPAAPRNGPRVEVNREARRAAIPPQPSRAVQPAPTAPAAPQARDRSTIVAEMNNRRNQPRGRITG